MSTLPASCSKPVRSGLGALALLLALLALGALAVACGGGSDATPAGEPAVAAPQPAAEQPTPTPTPPDPAALLAETAANARTLQSMRFAVTHETGSIFVSTVNAKATEARGAWHAVQGADITIDAYLVAGADAAPETGTYVELNMLVTPDSYFITDPLSGAWTKRPLDSLAVPIDQIADIMGDMLEVVENPELAGQETVDGVAAYRITGRAPSTVMEWLLITGVAGEYVDVEIWSDTEQKQLRKARLTGPISEYDDPNTVRQITLTDINESVSVEPPTDFLDLSQIQQ